MSINIENLPNLNSSLITYSELTSNIIDVISATCNNIGSYNPPAPDLSTNGTIVLSIEQLSGDLSCKVEAQTSNVFSPVSIVVVENQLSDFLSDRGLVSKPNTIVNTRGILNFYCNIAIFLDMKIKRFKSYLNDSDDNPITVCMYDKDGNIKENPAVYDGIQPSVALNDVLPAYQQILNHYMNIASNQSNTLIMKYSSSCCSSSSSCSSCSCSSSSCSCSSSSSSSSYIVYMII